MDEPLSSSLVPQADRVERVLEYALLGHAGHFDLRDLLFRGRDGLYYRAAAQVLGLLDSSAQASEAVSHYARGNAEALEVLRTGFERSAVAKEWAKWHGTNLWAVAPDSAPIFLRECSDLGEETAKRRGRTLAAWLEELAPSEAPPSIESQRAETLLKPLSSLRLSNRTRNVFSREKFERVLDAVVLDEEGLLALRGFGRTSLVDFEMAVLDLPAGESLKQLAEAVRLDQVDWPEAFETRPAISTDPSPNETPQEWADLQHHVPAHIQALTIDELDAPVRAQNVLRRENITTAGELIAYTQPQLLALDNFGRTTLRKTFERLVDLSTRYPTASDFEAGRSIAPEATFDPSEYNTLEALFLAKLETLTERHADILRRRSGVQGSGSTLQEIANTLDVSRERVRQLESKALSALLAEGGWLAPALSTFEQQCGANTYFMLSECEDEFLRGAAERPKFLTYFCDRLLSEQWASYPFEDDHLITATRSREPQAILDGIERALKRTKWPAPLSALDAVVDEALLDEELDLRPLFVATIRDAVILDDDEHPTEVLRVGSGRAARIIAHLHMRGEPISLSELNERFGRGSLPRDIVLSARGMYALPEHYPGFARWERRLIPLISQVMETEAPEREWQATALFEAVGDEAPLPAWLTPWLLASMMRRSGEFDDLGRQRFALKGATDGSRTHYMPTAIELLEEAGAPVDADRVKKVLEDRLDLQANTWNMVRYTPPIFATDDGKLGLMSRDIPGGVDAIKAAGDHLEVVLRRLERGLSAFQALQELQRLSEDFADWERSMVGVVARTHPALAASRGGLGLDEWDEPRVKTNATLLTEHLEAGDGYASVPAFERDYTELRGIPLKRTTLASIAYQVGAALRGDTVMLKGMDEEDGAKTPESSPPDSPPTSSTPAPSPTKPASEPHPSPELPTPPAPAQPSTLPQGLPSPRDLGLPRVARGLYSRLCAETPGDFTALLARCRQHAEQFEARMIENEFLPLAEAQALAAQLPKLVERAKTSGGENQARLAWIAGRYFEIADDGELDFTIGGLDDDVEVFNAIATHMGAPELCVAI